MLSAGSSPSMAHQTNSAAAEGLVHAVDVGAYRVVYFADGHGSSLHFSVVQGSWSASGIASHIGVRIMPGATALTRMGASSTARAVV
ncbi:hypothetical protein MSMEI_6700 [Mycolicibacterium smegmatis MC2 155]|uniref:Uncharacterized protein n=1 Tax=Mycolicibacterium smegmatis (strain ATCC 700084 / mc(2)155) TaxID=246196 RepID=I7GG93_MYCS2|nr:hypothetical protein MSMEI_6700 [Mycolicibacterium smegmatis MC2 155]